MSCLPADVLKASLMENALECIEPVKKQEVENTNKKEKSLCLNYLTFCLKKWLTR